MVKAEDARVRLAQLKPDERTALTLKAAGFSYAEIGERRDWTYSKVNRSLAELPPFGWRRLARRRPAPK